MKNNWNLKSQCALKWIKTWYYSVKQNSSFLLLWCIHLYRWGAVYEHTKIRAIATVQVLRVIMSVVWQFSLRLRSRAEWSGVPPKADTGAAESRNKTVNTWKNPVLHCWDIYRKVCSLSPLWYVCNVFYWLNNGVFYSITQLSYATSENWRHKAADLLGGMQAPRLGTRLQINSAEFVGLHAKK